MQHTKKMTLVPDYEMRGGGFEEEQVSVEPQPKKGNSIRKYAADRQRKLLNVVLKLAKYGGYDDSGRIKLSNGSYLEQSDVVSLLMYSLSPGRTIKGISEFVDLLYRARVSPENIINANVRDMLERRSFGDRPSNPRPHPRPPSPPTRFESHYDEEIDRHSIPETRPTEKRKRSLEKEDDDLVVRESEPLQKKLKNSLWDPNDSDLDE